MSRTRRLWAVMMVAAVFAIGLAGCARMDATLSIAGDTVSGTVIVALHKDAAERLEVDREEAFAEQDAELRSLDRVTAAPYDDGTWAGTEYTFDRVHLDDLNRMSRDDPDGLRITRDLEAGTYALTMVMDLVWLSELDRRDADRVDIRLAVTFPGEVVEHNGDLAGSTVTWRPPPGERTELRASAYAPDEPAAGAEAGDEASFDAVVLVVGLAVLVLAAAGLGASWLVRRRQPHPDPTSALVDYHPSSASPSDDEPTQRTT